MNVKGALSVLVGFLTILCMVLAGTAASLSADLNKANDGLVAQRAQIHSLQSVTSECLARLWPNEPTTPEPKIVHEVERCGKPRERAEWEQLLYRCSIVNDSGLFKVTFSRWVRPDGSVVP